MTRLWLASLSQHEVCMAAFRDTSVTCVLQRSFYFFCLDIRPNLYVRYRAQFQTFPLRSFYSVLLFCWACDAQDVL